jgi:hypothetical protein
MNEEKYMPPKAYKNLDFLNSSDARTIRILAEFLEPLQRFRKENIKDTIVFFGSARTKSLEEAKILLREAEEAVSLAKVNSDKVLKQKLAFARNQVFMAQYYEDARLLARRLTEWSLSLNSGQRYVICSGGGPGMMEASNRGAVEGGGKSIGLNISIPTEQFSNPYITPELNFEFHYFFMRKFWFVYLAKALVIFPGGFGTLDELFEVLTLIQTEKVLKKMPIVVYGKKYWDQIIDIKKMADFGVIGEQDLDLIYFSDSVDDSYNYLTDELLRLYPD